MKLIIYSKRTSNYCEKILNGVNCSNAAKVCISYNAQDFKEAIRTNTEPKPVIVFYVSETLSLKHLFEIRKYIADAVLFIIVPDDDHYQKVQMEFSVYPRYIFYRDDDPHILSAMLNKLMIKT